MRNGQEVLHSIGLPTPKTQDRLLGRISKCRRVLLIEANDQRRWVGGRVIPEVHIPPVGLMYVASSARRDHPDLEIRILETSMEARSEQELASKLLDYRPDLVGIRSISLFEDELKRVAEVTKRLLDVPLLGAVRSRRLGGARC